MPDPAAASTIDQLVRFRASHDGAKPMVIDRASRIRYRELDTTTRDLAATFVEAGVGKGTRVGLIMPNCTRWVQVAIALTRIGAVLVPLSTLLQAGELVAQLRLASVQFLVSVEEFRGHRYLDDLQSGRQSELPALGQVWTVDRLATATAGERPRGIVDAMTETVTAADPLIIIFTSGSSGAPKGVVHSHGSALGAARSGLAARCITSDTRLYLPMPFFWVGGFGSGILSVLLAGATLVTEEAPQPETTLRLLESQRVNLFRGWPDQAEALARHAGSVGVDLSALRPGSLEGLLAPEQRAQPGARATLFGMTEAFGPYCGYPADTDMPTAAWGSCGKPFPGMEVRIVDPDRGEPVAAGTVGMIEIRGPHTLRGICRRSREELFTADGFYPTGDLGHLKRGWVPLLPRPVRRHVQSQRRGRLPQRGRASAAQHRRRRQRLRHQRVRRRGRTGRRGGSVQPRAQRCAAEWICPQTVECVQSADCVAVAGIRRRRPARRHGQTRHPSAA